MEKDRHCRAYEGMNASNNGNTSSLKRSIGSSNAQSREVRCLCFGGVPDKASHHSFVKGFFINLGLCALLVAYTLLGSFIFLAIEGGTDGELQQRTLATTIASGNKLKEESRDSRKQTVENIWEITEHLNILYRENWTRLAEQEIARFQEILEKKITENMKVNQHTGTQATNNDRPAERKVVPETEWNFAKAFFYSLSVLTTIGHGGIAPRSSWGKLATMGYATFGIPLTLVYLSSAGGLLSRCARGVFTRAMCCCLCSNCGYCCYDERRMQEKERRMRKKRQQEEMNQQQQQPQIALQEPFYVRANASTYLSSVEIKASPRDEVSSLGSGDRPNVTIFAPISICLGAMICYIAGGAFTLYKLEGWNFVDASYFCFMSLSTIGFGDMVPGSYPNKSSLIIDTKDGTIWFCSCYIMSGLALTAMCFNILQDEILHHLTHQSDKRESIKPSCSIDELTNDPFTMTT